MSGIELIDAERFAHGTRARYVKGCRCDPCRRANAEYAKARYRAQARARAIDASGSSPVVALDRVRGDLVDASRARQHLAMLSAHGVGYKAAADAAGVARSLVANVAQGHSRHLRRFVETAILGVTTEDLAPAALVSNKPTKRAIKKLRTLGLTRAAIAQRLGMKSHALQIDVNDRVLVRTQRAVLALLETVQREQSREGLLACAECGLSHATRLNELRTYSSEEIAELPETWECLYGGKRGRALLAADLAAIGRAS